ncbi:MAG: hypothetical protein R2710_16210 [Acidimicrobiales bacterium]
MRGDRHLEFGARRRPASILRPVRPAAPRSGSGRHRRCRRQGGAACTEGQGLVNQVFNPDVLRPLTGGMAIGHTRYSTTGANSDRNVQPYVIETMHGPLGVAHQRQPRHRPAPSEAARASGRSPVVVGFDVIA